MSIQFQCPSGHTLHAPRGWIGRVIACPICQAATIVPTPRGARAVAARQMLEAHSPPTAAEKPKPAPIRRRGYRAEEVLEQSVRWLAVVLAAIAVVSAVPVAWHILGETIPAWVYGVVLLAAAQLAYVAWMSTLPDWSTVWVVTWVYAGACAIYALALAVGMFAPVEDSLPLGLDAVRRRIAGWSAAVIILQGLGAYLAGRFSVRWRAYCRTLNGQAPQ
jgi:hypothetical protein